MYLSLSALLLGACTNEMEEVVKEPRISFNEADVRLVDLSKELRFRSDAEGEDHLILQFKDQATFDRIVGELNQKPSEEVEEWEKGLGFTSLYAIYDQAMEDAADLEDSEEAYKAYKAKYSKYLYFPDYKDDGGAYLPVSKEELTNVLNKNGKVLIGDNMKDYTDITNYYQLQMSGQAMYDLGEDGSPGFRAFGVKDYIGKQYDSKWRDNEKGNRRLRLKVGRRVSAKGPLGSFRLHLHYEVSFRKKAVGLWINYWSNTEIHTSINIPGIVSLNAGEHIHNRPSSHDYYPFKIDKELYRPRPNAMGGEYVTTPIQGHCTILYRGFPNPAEFDFDMQGGFVFVI